MRRTCAQCRVDGISQAILRDTQSCLGTVAPSLDMTAEPCRHKRRAGAEAETNVVGVDHQADHPGADHLPCPTTCWARGSRMIPSLSDGAWGAGEHRCLLSATRPHAKAGSEPRPASHRIPAFSMLDLAYQYIKDETCKLCQIDGITGNSLSRGSVYYQTDVSL